MKKICLFAGFDNKSRIHDYVIYYIKALSRDADVYYMADCEMSDEELSKIAPYVKGAFALRHKKYDFGSWHLLIKKIGWENMEKYDQMILANDSCYGPLSYMGIVFKEMQKKNVDFWGITTNHEIGYHVQSYFMVLNNKIIRNETFRKFWETISINENYFEFVKNCEVLLTSILENEGFSFDSYVPNFRKDNLTKYPSTLIKKYKIPFIKVKSFISGDKTLFEWPKAVRKAVCKETSYDFEMIRRHIDSKDIGYAENCRKLCWQILKIKILSIRKKLFYFKKTKKDNFIVKLFCIPIFYVDTTKRTFFCKKNEET